MLLWICSLPLSTVIITTGAMSISEMIKKNHTLQVLNISDNSIGDEGIAAIASTLDNARICELRLWECNITITGVKSLAAGLIRNNTIKSLDVEGNDITVDGAIAILEAAVANGICQEVIIDDEYKRNGKVKDILEILEWRRDKRYEILSHDYCYYSYQINHLVSVPKRSIYGI